MQQRWIIGPVSCAMGGPATLPYIVCG